jgi:hypothetical protein
MQNLSPESAGLVRRPLAEATHLKHTPVPTRISFHPMTTAAATKIENRISSLMVMAGSGHIDVGNVRHEEAAPELLTN